MKSVKIIGDAYFGVSSFECPKCKGKIEIDYNLFVKNYPNGLIGQTVKCIPCDKDFKIKKVKWR